MKSLYIINAKGNSLVKAVERGSIEIFDEGVKYKWYKFGFSDEVFIPMDEITAFDIKKIWIWTSNKSQT